MIYSFIHISYIRQLRKSSTKQVENEWSSPTESNADGRPTYHGLRPSSPQILFTALLLLLQFHTAFGMILYIFCLVDQSPVVISAGCPLHTCHHQVRDTRYGRGAGFMGE